MVFRSEIIHAKDLKGLEKWLMTMPKKNPETGNSTGDLEPPLEG